MKSKAKQRCFVSLESLLGIILILKDKFALLAPGAKDTNDRASRIQICCMDSINKAHLQLSFYLPSG